MDFDGKHVIVTGGSSGLGQGICEMFSSEGAAVAVIDTRDGSGTVRRCSGPIEVFRADVADPEEVQRVFQEIDEYFKAAPHVLCNVAGITPEVAFLETPVHVFDRTIAVNLRGPFLCSQAAARRMSESNGGRIINITSTESVQAWALQSVYGASKAALRHLTMAMAVELASFNILVNAVGPGACETQALLDQMSSERIAQHDLERTPLGRWGKPADIAAAVRFLAGDASWMTGQTIYVDGGFLATGLPMFPELESVQRALPSAAETSPATPPLQNGVTP